MAKSGYYDKNKDYSKAIMDAMNRGASSAEINRLRRERQNKIDSRYQGRDPYRGSVDIMGRGGSGSGSTSRDSGSGSGTDRFTGHVTQTKVPGGVRGGYTVAQDGSIWLDDDSGWKGPATADLRRRPDLAGRTAMSHGQTVFYDENGYATRARRGVTGYRPHRDPYARTDRPVEHLWTDQEMLQGDDPARMQSIKDALRAGHLTAEQANRAANDIRRGYGYTIDTKGNVTDLRASGEAAVRREAWGLGGGLSREELDTLAAVYPNGLNVSGVSGDYLERRYGIPRKEAADGWADRAEGPDFTGTWSVPGGAGRGYVPDSAEETLRALYRRKQEAERERLRAAYEAEAGPVRDRTGWLDDLYARKRNQAAAENELERMRMAEMGLAHGLGTGGFGQLALGRSMAYQGVLGDLHARETADRAENDRRLDALRSKYLSAVEVSDARNEAELLDAILDDRRRREAALAAAEKQAAAERRWQLEWEADQAESKWKQDLKRAEVMAGWGDWSGYRELGLLAPDAPDPVRPGTSKKSGGRSGRRYHNGGLTDDQIRSMQTELGVTADGKWGSASRAAAGGLSAREAWKKYEKRQQEETRRDNGGRNARFQAFMRVVGSAMAQGNEHQARQLVREQLPNMTEGEKKWANWVLRR